MARTPPALTEHRLLPVGVHNLTLAEVEALFGSFLRSERRRALFSKLTEHMGEVRRALCMPTGVGVETAQARITITHPVRSPFVLRGL